MDGKLKKLLGEALPLLRDAVALLKDVRGAQEELTEAVMAQTSAVKDLADGLKPAEGKNPIVEALEKVGEAVGRVEQGQTALREELPTKLGEEVEHRMAEAIEAAGGAGAAPAPAGEPAREAVPA